MGHYFQRLCRLNQGLDVSHWRIYEHKEEPNGVHLLLSINTTSVMVLNRMGCRPFSGMGQAIFSLLDVKPEGRKYDETEVEKEKEEEAECVMVSNIMYSSQPAA